MTDKVQFGIHFGFMCDSIYKQVKDQGFKIYAHEARGLQQLSEAILTVWIAGLMPDSQKNKMQDKLFAKIKKALVKTETTKP